MSKTLDYIEKLKSGSAKTEGGAVIDIEATALTTYGRTNLGDYLTIPLLTFFSCIAISKGCTCPLLQRY